jgi:MSHA pilin protein MshA
MKSKKQAGFTLIELIIVIIILAILVAFAIPKYMSLDTTARTNVVYGMQGALRSAAAMVRVVAKANGAPGGIVTIDTSTGANVTVNTTTYYPVASAAGIVAALESTAGFTITGATIFQLNTAPGGVTNTCAVSYDPSVSPPNVIATVTGC